MFQFHLVDFSHSSLRSFPPCVPRGVPCSLNQKCDPTDGCCNNAHLLLPPPTWTRKHSAVPPPLPSFTLLYCSSVSVRAQDDTAVQKLPSLTWGSAVSFLIVHEVFLICISSVSFQYMSSDVFSLSTALWLDWPTLIKKHAVYKYLDTNAPSFTSKTFAISWEKRHRGVAGSCCGVLVAACGRFYSRVLKLKPLVVTQPRH